ncbi:exonuclease III [Sphaerochaeta pleomorpha str. Grapes]|uniref:Exonuclease III n=1 Tax=Sphaerochaeta pleomorpha (strain ATCC BAA-1885 / DSM 22778 / Grapes) TaxID=158190 RepID=G8QTJ3_SPHPG|nr:endonuclease/exonuclease/phosphatase family protein [Sphaerochaeta pleomorpha]AEV30234.1 exonuclease III [Sphaerochaeta pleomorpha str. Grapes]
MKIPVILLVILTFCGCSLDANAKEDTTFKILTYNVQNLMDDKLDGTEYEEYKPSASWNTDAYYQRLKKVAQVLSYRDIGLCDVLVLQEVENATVVEDLLRRHLARKGYIWFATAREKGGAISTALISRQKPERVLVHQVPSARPVIEAVFATEEGYVSVFAVHAKSQIGDPGETEALRLEMARTVTGAAGKDNDHLIVVCGDFNEDPDAFTQGSGNQTALIQTTSSEARPFMATGSFGITGMQEEVFADAWYSPFLDEENHFTLAGSCYFSGQWHRYDQFLGNGMLFDRKGWEYGSCKVIAPSFCSNADQTPLGWRVESKSGVSDHYPVLLTLVKTL